MWLMEQDQCRAKAFVDHHRKGNERSFKIDKAILAFQTQMGQMLGKLLFWWTGPYWIIDAIKGTYQLGTLAGEVLPKWGNGFRLKPYAGPTPPNPFSETNNGNEKVIRANPT